MRKLALKKESLVELTTDELTLVNGASGVSCLTPLLTGNSDFQECITGIRCI